MNEAHTGADPCWGQQDRDKKAEAILRTVQLCAGPDVTHGTWLDIGCGSGGVSATLAQHVERVIGIDPEAWARWGQFRMDHFNLDLRQGSYRDLRTLLRPGSIDVVVCNQVYEHVDDPGALLVEIHRVMKPGGLCYFAGPNLLWPIEPHVFWPFVHWLPRSFAQDCMRMLGSKRAHDLDAWSWSYWKLTRYFRLSGFSYVSVIPERVRAGISASRPKLARVLVCVPHSVATMLTPLSPAFVFVLHKLDG